MEDFELCHTFRIIVKLIYYLFSKRPFLPSYVMRLESGEPQLRRCCWMSVKSTRVEHETKLNIQSKRNIYIFILTTSGNVN